MTSKQTEAKQKSSSHTPLTSSFIHCVFLIFPSSFWFHPSPWETIKDDMPKHTLLYISICMPRFSFVCSNTRPHKTILDRETENWKKHTWIENEKRKTGSDRMSQVRISAISGFVPWKHIQVFKSTVTQTSQVNKEMTTDTSMALIRSPPLPICLLYNSHSLSALSVPAH